MDRPEGIMSEGKVICKVVRGYSAQQVFHEQREETLEGVPCTFEKLTIDGNVGWYINLTTAGLLKEVGLYSGDTTGFKNRSLAESHSPNLHKIYNFQAMKNIGQIFHDLEHRFICYYAETKDGSAKINLTLLLAFFCSDESMKPLYESYMRNPDTGVVVDTTTFGETGYLIGTPREEQTLATRIRDIKVILDEMEKSGYPLKRYSTGKALDGIERDFLVLIIGLCISKGFKKDISEQFEMYVQNRMMAYYLSTGCGEKTSKFNKEVFDDGLMDIQTTFTFYPKLKRIIYSYLLTVGGTLTTYSRTILSYSQSSVFNFIRSFIFETTPTEAHFSMLLIPQINAWYRTYKLLLAEYKENLPYAKLLNPTDQRMSNKNWMLLARVSIVIRTSNEKAGSIQNIRGYSLRIPKPLISMLSKTVSPELIEGQVGPVGALQPELLGAMGLKKGVELTFLDIDHITREELYEICYNQSNRK
jgi:hypothetical protein